MKRNELKYRLRRGLATGMSIAMLALTFDVMFIIGFLK